MIKTITVALLITGSLQAVDTPLDRAKQSRDKIAELKRACITDKAYTDKEKMVCLGYSPDGSPEVDSLLLKMEEEGWL